MVESRHSYNCRCRYWNPRLDKNELQNLIISNSSDGLFFAKEAQQSSKTEQIDNGMVMIDNQMTVIETLDNIEKLEKHARVKYLEQMWIVEDIRFTIRNRTTEYNVRPTKIWQVTLRNGN